MYEKLKEYILKILNIEKHILEKCANTPYCQITDLELREKILVYRTYYNFLEYPECVAILEKIYKTINNVYENKIEKNYTISIIILKSFLEKKIYDVSEKYINSDEIFNYIVEEYQKYLLIKKIYIGEKQIQLLMLHILDILDHEGVILSKIVKMAGAHLKTYKYYALKVETYLNLSNDFFVFSFMDFKIIEYDERVFITTLHYSKTHELNKKNFKSDRAFKIKNMNYIIQKINLKLKVDDEFQKILRAKTTNEVGVLKEKIRRLLETLNLYYEKELWTSTTKEEIGQIQNEISKLKYDMILIEFTHYDFKGLDLIYPLYLDFRGRKYYYSSIGPTNSKILRLAYYYGYYKKSDFKVCEIESILQHKNTIINFCKKFNYLYKDVYLETYFWLLIGIGKFLVDKNKYPITVDEFIDKGISYFSSQICLKLEDELEIELYKLIMKSLINDKIKKRIIVKDATASINQIFMKRLGPINKESLMYVNLGEKNKWFDTYLVYRDKFYEEILNLNEFKKFTNKDIFNNIFARKLIKNTIMITPYSAGFKLCWKNYVNSIKENNSEIIIDKDLEKIYKAFYLFIKNTMQTKYLYKKSTQNLIDRINEEFENARKHVLESETGISDISYYKLKKSTIDKKYILHGKSMRITKLILKPTEAIDIDSFNIASGANIAHFLDADEIRSIEIVLGYSIMTIHDSYLIDFLNCSQLVYIKIAHYQKAINRFSKKYTVGNFFILL